MIRINFVKSWIALSVISFSQSLSPACHADGAVDAPVKNSQTEQPVPDVALAQRQLKLTEQTRLVWSLLETIQRHHISAPSRGDLISIVAGVMNGLGREPRSSDVTAEMLRCQNAAEFSELLSRNWRSRSEIPVDAIATTVVKTLEESLGPLRLIRNQDANVEQQFSGNRYVGLGVALSVDAKCARFHNIVPGGPAERAGLDSNTEILEIDGRTTEGVPIETVLDWLRGQIGTDVTLKIRDPKATSQRTITITRGVVRFDSVINEAGMPLARGVIRLNETEPIGCLHVTDISSSTLHELRTAEELARRQGIRVLILDLRNSKRSGDFHQALLIADGLLDGGTIWKHTSRATETKADLADRDCLFRDMGLVVLVNQFTGNAQAAVAAALQDSGRASVVGSSPAFSGLFSEIVPLEGEPFSISMETLRLTRANGAKNWPLVPDHLVGPEAQNDRQNRMTHINPPRAIVQKPASETPLKDLVVRVQEIANPPASALIPTNKPRVLPGWPNQRIVRQLVEQREISAPKFEPARENEAALTVARRLLRDMASQTQ